MLSLPNRTPFIPWIQVYITDCDTRLWYKNLPSDCVISNPRFNLSVPKSFRGMISVFAAQTIYATLNTSSDVWWPCLQNVPGSWVFCTQLGKLNRVVPQTLCLQGPLSNIFKCQESSPTMTRVCFVPVHWENNDRSSCWYRHFLEWICISLFETASLPSRKTKLPICGSHCIYSHSGQCCSSSTYGLTLMLRSFQRYSALRSQTTDHS